jgi:hypothetical protein
MIKEAIRNLSKKNNWVKIEDIYQKLWNYHTRESIVIELETLRQIGKVEIDSKNLKVKII